MTRIRFPRRALAAQSLDERMALGLSNAIAAALCVVTARAQTPELDTDGWDLYVASKHAKACGASEAQVVTAMRSHTHPEA
jgi:hypothetical protein